MLRVKDKSSKDKEPEPKKPAPKKAEPKKGGNPFAGGGGKPPMPKGPAPDLMGDDPMADDGMEQGDMGGMDPSMMGGDPSMGGGAPEEQGGPLDPATVLYRTSDEVMQEVCGNCMFFDNGSCLLVSGPIDPGGHCSVFTPGQAPQADQGMDPGMMEGMAPPQGGGGFPQ